MHRAFSLACLAILFSLSCAAASAERVTVFAAASLKTVLDALAADLPHDVALAYGGSAAMARQIAQGAGADIVILAHPDWMDWLETRDVIDPARRCDLAGNRLVLAAPEGAQDFTPESEEALLARLGAGRLAVGRLDVVPVGQYTRQWLEHEGWLEALRPHLAEVNNARLALALVARGEVPLGVLYASDVAAEPRVRTVFEIAAEAHAPIRYPIALSKTASDAARQVRDALVAAAPRFEAFGFAPLTPGAPGCVRP